MKNSIEQHTHTYIQNHTHTHSQKNAEIDSCCGSKKKKKAQKKIREFLCKCFVSCSCAGKLENRARQFSFSNKQKITILKHQNNVTRENQHYQQQHFFLLQQILSFFTTCSIESIEERERARAQSRRRRRRRRRASITGCVFITN